jgi:nucleoid DNA-binding protein
MQGKKDDNGSVQYIKIKKIVCKETGHDMRDVTGVLDSCYRAIMDIVLEGKTCYIKGFGTFTTKIKRERKQKVLNSQQNLKKKPKKFQYTIVPAHCIPVFKPSQDFKNRVRMEVKVDPIKLKRIEKNNNRIRNKKKS